MPVIWLLHIGIFAVWLPTVFLLKKNEELKTYHQRGILKNTNPFAIFRIIFRQTPTWLKVIAILGFFYAVINFIMFMATQSGVADIKDGQYILHNHGQLIRILTEQEYHHFKANELRGFSGHWLAFYGPAAAVLFPFSKQQQDDQTLRILG
jgi:hypothetical protein